MFHWALALLLIAAMLLIAEALLPTAGVLGFVAIIAGIAGLTMMFMHDRTAGIATTIVVLMLTPIGIAGFLKIWPRTPVGRALTLSSSVQHVAPQPGIAHADLVGAIGQVLTPMRPVGMCRFDNQRLECISVGDMLEPGTKVQVVAVAGLEVKVKAI